MTTKNCHQGFAYEKHFLSEGKLFGSGSALLNLITLTVWLPFLIVELITLNSIKIRKPVLFPPAREVTDLTFKDMVIWYLEGLYKTAAKVKYVLKKHQRKSWAPKPDEHLFTLSENPAWPENIDFPFSTYF